MTNPAERLQLTGRALGVVCAFGLLTMAAGCARKPTAPVQPASPPPPANAATPPVASADDVDAEPAPRASASVPWAGSMLRGNDPDAIKAYLQTVTEIKPTRFKVEWNPATVAFDRDAAMRALREVSQDGRQFTLDPAEPAAAKLRPGSILWIWDITVSKVERVDHRDGSLVVTTTPVALTEAIPNADIAFESPVHTANFLLDRRQPHEPAKQAAVVSPNGGGYIRQVVFAVPADNPDAGSTPAATPDAPAAPADGSTTNEEDSFDGNTYSATLKGFDVRVGYAPMQGDALRLLIEARTHDDSGSAPTPEELLNKTEALKQAQAAVKQAEAEVKKLRTQLYQELEQGADKVKIFAVKQAIAEAVKQLTKKQADKSALAKARSALQSKFWTVFSDALDVRFKMRADLRGFSAAAHYLFSQGQAQETSLAFKAIDGDARVKFVARLGEKGVKGITIPLMSVPIEFNVPMPVGGIPFVVQLAADFNLKLFLGGEHAAMAIDGKYAFNGNTGFTASSTSATINGSMVAKVPDIVKYQGFTPAASGFVLGVQNPKLGFGLGLFGASTMAFTDMVSVLTMTSASSAVAGIVSPCKRMTFLATGRVGIETKLLPIPIEALQDWAKDKLTVKKEIWKKETVILDPPIKACELNDS